MKRCSLLLALFLFNYFFVSFESKAQPRQEGGMTDTPFSGDIPDDGNNTLGQTYNNTQCGLNYIISSRMITQRYTGPPTGSGLPTSLTMNMPPCIGTNGQNVLRAYIWWGVSYTSGSSTTPTITVTNPVGGVFSYTATMAGQSGTKCWAEVGTRTFRADVTTCINTSGNYSINISGNTASEIDGATFVIIYRDPVATYRGTIIINDGCQTFANGTPSTMTVSGFTACANSVNGSGFSVTGDQQNNVSPPSHQTTINSVTQTFSNTFWNTDIISTNVSTGQTSVGFTNTPSSSDCWSWNVIGYYFQTTGCTTGTVVGLTSTVTSQNATCGQNNGWANANVSGGTAPYTYWWSTSPVQTSATATGLGAGTYTCSITDASGCNATVIMVTITQPTGVSSVVSTSNACFGQSNGFAAVTAMGGTPGYSYLWSPSGGTGTTASNLSAGTYTVTITDSQGCTITSTAVVGNNDNPTVSSIIDYSDCPFDPQQTVYTVFTGDSYTDVTVCASGPSGYVTDNQVCTDPNNVDCAGHFQKDSLVAPYSVMGSSLTSVSIQSVYVSLDTITGNNSRGCGYDNRLWLRSPGGTLYLLAAQKTSNNTTTNKYKPVFTIAAPQGILPNALGSYNLYGYRPDQGSLSSAPWIGEAPGATWSGNSNENYIHAAGQWTVYLNDQVAGCSSNNQTKITEFCITFRTYPPPTYSWTVDPGSSPGCGSYLSSTTIPDPILTTPSEANYNCTYTLVATDAMGCTATTSINIFCGVLPATLLNYSGKNIASGNKLEWITASETNNSFFTIQRSSDGSAFTDLEKVLSRAANGNSTTPHYYTILDKDVKPGKYYYRLRQTDINGDSEELGVVVIEVKSAEFLFTIKPNPNTGRFEVIYECNDDRMATLHLYNDKGILQKRIEVFCVQGQNTFPVDLTGFTDGLYLVTLSNNDFVYKAKLVKSQ
jgi:hypothetical protein